MAEPHYLRKIAADDFYMQICKAYSDSDTPFGMIDCEYLISAFRDAFSRERADKLSYLPQRTLLSAIRNFVGGVTCAYERELCDILSRMYRVSDGTHINASKLLGDFASIIAIRSEPSSRLSGRNSISKVELRHAISAWITEGAVAARASVSPTTRKTSPTRERPSGLVSPALSVPSTSPPVVPRTASPPRTKSTSPRSFHSPKSGYSGTHLLQAIAPLRLGGSSLSTLVGQLEHAARESERALSEADELVGGWQQRAREAEIEARTATDEKERALRELAHARSELSSASRQNISMEERMEVLNRRHAEALSLADAQLSEFRDQRMRLESRIAELESIVSVTTSELAAAESVNASLRDQRAGLLEEMSELKREHAMQMKQQHATAQELREVAEASAAEATLKARGEYETMRLELSGRIQMEQECTAGERQGLLPDESVARLRSEVHSLRAENERLGMELAAERSEYHTKFARQEDLHRANVSRLESQIASIQSQAALELEKLRSQMADDRQRSQTMVMEAKHETARAKAETLQAVISCRFLFAVEHHSKHSNA